MRQAHKNGSSKSQASKLKQIRRTESDLNPKRGERAFVFWNLSFGAYHASVLVLIDNYDSFTYNLVQRFGEVSPRLKIEVFRNDKITVDQVESLKPTHIVISPGPCTPREGGDSRLLSYGNLFVIDRAVEPPPNIADVLGFRCVFRAGCKSPPAVSLEY